MATSEPVTIYNKDGAKFTYIIVGTEKLEAACDRARQRIYELMKRNSDEDLAVFTEFKKKRGIE